MCSTWAAGSVNGAGFGSRCRLATLAVAAAGSAAGSMLICRCGGFGRHTPRLFATGERIGSAGVAGGVGAIALPVSSFHGPKPGGGVAPGGGVVMMSGECRSSECGGVLMPAVTI